MIISNPKNSFVDFNTPLVDRYGQVTDFALPVFENFGIKFQFSVTDELLPISTQFKAGIVNMGGNLIYTSPANAQNICSRFSFIVDGVPLTNEDFPIEIGNYAPGNQPAPGLYNKPDFLAALSAFYEYQFSGTDFINCCSDQVPEVSDVVVIPGGIGPARNMDLVEYFAGAWVDFPETSMNGYIGIDQCFRYAILNQANEVLGVSNIFTRIDNDWLTTVFTYYNKENGLGFKYVVLPDGTITENTIRLHLYLDTPSFDSTENNFRTSSLRYERLSTVIEETWTAKTHMLSSAQHKKVVTMLKHDLLNVEHRRLGMNRPMSSIGQYDINYPDINMPPGAMASFSLLDDTQSLSNNNCGFNCGVEILDPCDGNDTPSSDRYFIEFTVPSIQMGIGDTTYQDDNFVGSVDVEVYRGGVIQYKTGVNRYAFNSATGTITFTPAVTNQERISIWEI